MTDLGLRYVLWEIGVLSFFLRVLSERKAHLEEICLSSWGGLAWNLTQSFLYLHSNMITRVFLRCVQSLSHNQLTPPTTILPPNALSSKLLLSVSQLLPFIVGSLPTSVSPQSEQTFLSLLMSILWGDVPEHLYNTPLFHRAFLHYISYGIFFRTFEGKEQCILLRVTHIASTIFTVNPLKTLFTFIYNCTHEKALSFLWENPYRH